MNINLTRAIFRQRQAARWFSVAEHSRQRYDETQWSGHLSAYHEAAGRAKFFYASARYLSGQITADQAIVNSKG